jgi:uncharacterized protein YcbK (DUF882 family)
MITMNEILKGTKWDTLPKGIQDNLKVTLERANKIRTEWGKPMTVTSGIRTIEDHLRIYKEKGITDLKKIPMQSKHLTGQAVDVFDPKLELTAWLKQDKTRLEKAELWCEEGNKNWVHFQTLPPLSGNRWFNP